MIKLPRINRREEGKCMENYNIFFGRLKYNIKYM